MKKQYITMLLVLSTTVIAYSQINLLSQNINLRDYNTANNTTYHYGDLSVSGGSSGTDWGWLTCNKIVCNSGTTLYGTTSVYGDFNVMWGTKNFIQPHPTDTTKLIKYIAIEAGEALTIAKGMAKTENGIITIDLPEHFGLVTSDSVPVIVLLTPEKAPAMLYIKEKSKLKITVAMKSADYSEFGDVDFAYQVTGVRDGYEKEQVIIDADSFYNGSDEKLNNPVKQRAENFAEKSKKAMTLKKKGK